MPKIIGGSLHEHREQTRLRLFGAMSRLMAERGFDGEVLVDQGTSDQFLDLLKPEALAHAMAARRQPGAFRLQQGYDHSYYFVSTFIPDHIAFHAEALYR